MKKQDYSHEIIFIDDGSTDDSWKIITNISCKQVLVSKHETEF